MRILTTAQSLILQEADRATFGRVRVADATGTLIDLRDLEGHNWIDKVSWTDNIDKAIRKFSVSLFRNRGDLSLAPLVDKSKLNISGAMLALSRQLLIDIAIVAQGSQPESADWINILDGLIDQIGWAQDPITIIGRDKGGRLVDTYIKDQKLYPAPASGPGANDRKQESVIQDIIDDNNVAIDVVGADFTWDGTATILSGDTSEVNVGDFICLTAAPYFKITAITPNVDVTITNPATRTASSGGGTSSTIRIPAADRVPLFSVSGTATEPFKPADSSGFILNDYKQGKDGLFKVIRGIALLPGWDLRYRWQNTVGSFQLILYDPDRSKTTPDFTFAPNRVLAFSQLDLSLKDIRNDLRGVFTDTSGARTEVIRTDAASIAAHGDRFAEFTEAADSQIDTNAEMTAFLDAALSDLAEPDAIAGITAPLFWPGEVTDLYRLSPDDRFFDSNQDLAASAFRHTISRKEAQSIINVRGTPSGGRRRWSERFSLGGLNPPVDQFQDTGADNIATEVLQNIGGVIITYDDPVFMTPPVVDWAYTECHVGTAPSFVVGPGTLKQKGRTTRFEIGGLTPGVTFFIKLRIIDIAGNIGAESSEIQATAFQYAAIHKNNDTINDNLILNGDFSHATLDPITNVPDRWNFSLPGSGAPYAYGTGLDVEQELTQQQTGFRSIRLNGDGLGTVSSGIVSDFFPVSRNTLYRVSVVVKAITSTPTYRVFVDLFDRDKSSIGGVFLDVVNVLAPSAFTLRDFFAYIAETVSGARFAQVGIRMDGSTSGESMFVDRIVVQRGKQTFEVYNSVGQSIPQNADTEIAFDQTQVDIINRSIGGTTYGFSSNRYRALEPGHYSFQSAVSVDFNSANKSGEIGFFIYPAAGGGPNRLRGGNEIKQSNTNTRRLVVSATVDLVRDDRVSVFYRHNDGSSIALVAGLDESWFTGSRTE